jgi:hypothetical protein
MQRLHSSSAKSISIHDAVIRMQLVHLLYYQICSADSSYPLVIVVEPTQYWDRHHLAHCMLRGTRRSMPSRDLLLNTLMRSGLVEVRHILDFAPAEATSHGRSADGQGILAAHSYTHW